MELRHLRYFVAVAEALHFGRAASALGVAQPSVSYQILQLEAELETSLLRRTKRRVELTPAGRLFLEEAREILARANRAAALARRAGRVDGRALRVAMSYYIDSSAVIAAVSSFQRKDPTVRIELQTIALPLQREALRAERIDVGFLRPPVEEPSLRSEVLRREPFAVAVSARHRLSAREPIRLATLAAESFVFVPRDLAPVYHDAVLTACRRAGFVPNTLHEADSIAMILRMVGAGGAVSLVPASARKIGQAQVVIRSLGPDAPTIDTAIAWRRDNESPLVEHFVAIARRAFKSGEVSRRR